MTGTLSTNRLPSPSMSMTRGFQSYLNYVYSLPILSEEEERELFIRFQENNDLEAARTLTLSHLRFVAFIARRYISYGLPFEDLVQEGSLGLMKSVKRFDLSYGVRLASFAVHWIKAELHDYVLKNWKLVKIATTKAQRKLFFNLRKMKQRLGWMNRDETQEVARYLQVSVSDVSEMEARLHQQDSYFDESFGESILDEHSHCSAPSILLEDHSYNPERHVADNDFTCRYTEEIQQFLPTLDRRSVDIIESRWYREGSERSSLKDLSRKYSISQERVRQIEFDTLKKIRQHLCAKGISLDDMPAKTCY